MKIEQLYIPTGRHFKIHILFLPLLAASILGGYFGDFSFAYISALLHELAHISVALLLGVKVSHIELLPFGICGRLKDSIIRNPNHEILIAISGPILNLVITLSVFIANIYINFPYNTYIIKINTLLAMINLFPILPLDGGRILRAYLTKRMGIIMASKVTNIISAVLTVLLIGISVYGLLTLTFNFSLILICAFLLSNLCNEQKSISKNIVNEVLDYQNKLVPNDFTKSIVITAHKDTPARRILKHLSYDRYHIICVTDDDFKVIKIIAEGELLSSITNRSIRITLGEI